MLRHAPFTTSLSAFHRYQQRFPAALYRPDSLKGPKGEGAERSSLLESVLRTPGLERPEGGDPAQLLKITEAFWKGMKQQQQQQKQQQGASRQPKAATVVQRLPEKVLGSAPQYDACVSGGNLGVLLALALQQRGYRVCIVEKRRLQGRNQVRSCFLSLGFLLLPLLCDAVSPLTTMLSTHA
jgi:hypothetical protein